MKKLIEFLRANKYAVLWTVAYVAAMWAILRGMFNFNMFSAAQWNHLIHAELQGFAGFVFGILILAAAPIYIATTTLIIRTKSPLFTIGLPKFMTPTPADPATPVAAPSEPDTQTTSDTAEPKLPDNLPGELRGAFIRARARAEHTLNPPAPVPAAQAPAPQNPQPAPVMVATPTAPQNASMTAPTITDTPPAIDIDPTGELPLPADFDLGDTVFDDPMTQMDAPTFTEINFDDAPATTVPEPNHTPTPPQPADAETTKYLTEQGRPVTTDGDIIITTGIAIAVHRDNEFWIADTTDWFAAGAQKPSPVAALMRTATERRLRPVLYMASTNIMDFETRRTEWESMGITVITSLNELPE